MSEGARVTLAGEREYARRVDQLTTEFEEEKKSNVDITQGMIRHYESVQEQLLDKVSLSLNYIFHSIELFYCNYNTEIDS